MSRTLRQRLRLLALRLAARLLPAPQAANPATPVHRILVVRPDHLGDVLFCTPALRVLRQRHPDAHITALVGPWGAPVLAGNPHVDEIITLPFPGFTRQPKPSPWQPYTLLRAWAQRLRGQFDLALVLRFDHWWGALLTHLAGVPRRVGYAVPEVAPFLSHALTYSSDRHEVAQNLALLNWDSPPGKPPDPLSHPIEFFGSEQAAVWARNLTQNRRPIVIHPGTGAAVKLWRAEGWAQVADALAQETASQVVLTGAAQEKGMCNAIADQMTSSAWVIAGETTLDQMAALFARCRLALGVDSGPMHLAVAVSTPTVHLYGPVDRTRFGPWGPPERHRALASAWPCIPCNRLDYAEDEVAFHPCVREITVGEVLDAARRVLSA